MADEKQNQFMLLALVGIVAVVGIVGLTMVLIGGNGRVLIGSEESLVNDVGGAMHVPDTYGVCGEDAYLPCDQTKDIACCKAKKGNGFPDCMLFRDDCVNRVSTPAD